MGVYKEASYFGNDAFFEQLFKHEGICVWNDDDVYDFMSSAREEAWPSGCVKTNYGVYLDLKPTLNGNMSYGLYTDEICRSAYTGSDLYVDLVAKNMGLLSGSSMNMWNDALEVFKTCQPCRAYNLAKQYNANGNSYGYGGSSSSSSSSSSNNYYSNYNKYGNRRDEEEGEEEEEEEGKTRTNNRNLGGSDYDPYTDPNEGYFQCNDDAGYTNVNQCMKFRSHADLEVATWEDLVIATEQGGILDIDIGGTTFGIAKMNVAEQLYMQQLREKQLRKEEADYRALVASVPSSKPVVMAGTMAIAIGAVALTFVLLWIFCRACCGSSRRSSSRDEGDDAEQHLHDDDTRQREYEKYMRHQQYQEQMAAAAAQGLAPPTFSYDNEQEQYPQQQQHLSPENQIYQPMDDASTQLQDQYYQQHGQMT
jgi:hypothetical protein